MKKLHLLILSCLFSITMRAQVENFIRIIVPERDTITTTTRFQRLNGSTLPGSELKINGVALKVYPTGAFAGFPAIKEGENRWIFESVHPTGGKAVKTIIINCTIPVPERAVTGFSVEYARTNPPVFQSLQTGDILQVRMKAQSGCQATFLKGVPMFELPITQTNGIAGIYQGSLKVENGDTLREAPLPFTLKNGEGEILHTESSTRISLNGGEFPAVGMTRGTLPYFSYGLGEDRLGGARVSYLDTLVLLNLVGRTGDLYHVRLSESQSVYVPASSVTILPKGTFPPFSLTGSWTVTGDDRHDYLRIGLSQRLPYVSKYELNPLRIILDVYGAVSNTNWITQLNSAREIKNVHYEQPEKNVMRVTIELKNETAWGYLVFYERNQLVVRVKQQPPLLALHKLTIGLDAGHGGSANGALGSTGSKEKDINLSVVTKLKTALEKLGARVILTRDSDYDVATSKRWLIWREADPDIALSLHCNSIGNSDPIRVKGTSTYYKYIAFRPLSQYLYDEMLKTGLTEFGNIGSFNFLLNGPTEFPNALIEMAFMSNPDDEMNLLDPSFQDRMVKGILAGLEKYLEAAKP